MDLEYAKMKDALKSKNFEAGTIIYNKNKDDIAIFSLYLKLVKEHELFGYCKEIIEEFFKRKEKEGISFENCNKVIISHYIDTLIKLNLLDEALEIANKHDYDKVIMLQKVTILFEKYLSKKEKHYIIYDYLHENLEHDKIKSKLCYFYKRLERFDKVIEVADLAPNNKLLKLQKIEALLVQKKYEEVMNLCDEHLNEFGYYDKAEFMYLKAEKELQKVRRGE